MRQKNMTQGVYGRDELSPRDQTHPGEMKDADKHQEKAKLRTIRLIEKELGNYPISVRGIRYLERLPLVLSRARGPALFITVYTCRIVAPGIRTKPNDLFEERRRVTSTTTFTQPSKP